MTGWISVDERLPDREGLYICLVNDERWLCCFTPGKGWLVEENSPPVTHWKPAPIRQHD